MALRSFREGDNVKAIVLSIDVERRRISFGLKPSYFQDKDFQAQDASDEDRQTELLGVVDEDSEEDVPENSEEENNEEESDEANGSGDDGDMNVDLEVDADEPMFSLSHGPATAGSHSHNALRLDDGFQWSTTGADNDVEMESSSEEEDNDEGQKSRKKKRKHKEIEQDLTADLQTKTPESNADFERVLLGSPNSSFLWVQYMSFQLQLAEVDKAREIARRALKTINFREEQEKLNVWIALLNLENVYGTEDTLESTFKDAARHNDSKTVHLRLATILGQSERIEVSSLVVY